MLEYYDMYIFLTSLIYVVGSLKIRSNIASWSWYMITTYYIVEPSVSSLSFHYPSPITYGSAEPDHGIQLLGLIVGYRIFARIIMIYIHKNGYK